MAGWLGIDSANIDSLCGQEGGATLASALDGTHYWVHNTAHVHQFVLDLGESKWVTRVRGRSAWTADPTDVNIYVSDNKLAWGSAVVTGITLWKGRTYWMEYAATPKRGRYVKVEIVATEAGTPGNLSFGNFTSSFTIFDVYIGAPPVKRSRSGFRPIEGYERLTGIRSNELY